MARNAVGSNALLTYAVAQRLAKRPETAALAPHVADMKSALGARRKAKTKPPRSREPGSVHSGRALAGDAIVTDDRSQDEGVTGLVQ